MARMPARRCVDAVAEREEGIRGHHASGNLQIGCSAFQAAICALTTRLICPAPMPIVRLVAGVDDGVGLHVHREFPGKHQIGNSWAVGARWLTTLRSCARKLSRRHPVPAGHQQSACSQRVAPAGVQRAGGEHAHIRFAGERASARSW
jgi:hypothetical protein